MFLFKIDKRLQPIKEQKIELEKYTQKLTEENLENIFGLEFVETEFALQSFRIDTLAFDKEDNSFVIIEYKRDRSFSVVDQGYSYLSLLLKNKASFVLKYNNKFKKNFEEKDIDWSQSRVIFIANSFTSYQKNAINFKDLPIELWEFSKYDDGLVSYNPIIAVNAVESIKTITKNNTEISKVATEVKQYSIEDHFKESWNNSRELFNELRGRILEIDNRIEEKPNKGYIGYKISTSNLVCVYIQKIGLRLELIRVDIEDLKDPEHKLKKINYKERGWGKMCVYSILVNEDIDYALFLIKQIYNKFYNK